MPFETSSSMTSATGSHHRLLYHYVFYLAILTVAILITTVVNSRMLTETTYRVTRSDLHSVATVVGNLLPTEALQDKAAAQSFCKTAAFDTGTRITLIRPDGTVIGDSAADPETMENHADRPEIRAAMNGTEGISRRYSATVNRTLMYAALPVLVNGEVAGVVRTSLPVADVEALLRNLYTRTALTAAVLLFLSLLVTTLISRSLRRPLRNLHAAAEAYSRGEFEHDIPITGPRELQNLAVALNSMAQELRRRIEEVEAQRRETEEVLNTIREPLILLDDQLRIRRVNLAAIRLAGTEHGTLLNRPLLEVFRNAELEAFAEELLGTAARDHAAPPDDAGGPDHTGSREETEIIYYGEPESRLRVWGTRLTSPGAVLQGTVLILMRDVTQEHRVDQIRKDFVANVSHELKTPLTMITGAVETLEEIEGENDSRSRFQRMITENAQRMEAIIEDLLSLARIEQTELATLPKRSVPVKRILEEAREVVRTGHPEAKAVISLEAPTELSVSVHPALLVQAVGNLLNNSVKYADPEVQITLSARRRDDGVIIEISDNGWGIPLRDQERIFERFYRVDRSRSRESGGTGLGLSIVRHVVRLHGGNVELESSPGAGSTFTIILPGEQV